MSSAETPPGWLSSFRLLGDGLLGSLQNRVELVSVELQEEKFRLIQTLIWIGAAMLAGALALLFASLALVGLFWDSARLTVLGGLALFYGATAVTIALSVRRHLARQPRPFESTIEEIAEDRACIPKAN